MKLKRLHLKNFRCFEDLTINFNGQLTVITAENGAGKTAILDAIAIGFGRYLTKLPGVAGRTVKDSDIRISMDEKYEAFTLIGLEASVAENTPLIWGGIRRRDGTVTSDVVKSALSEEAKSFLKHGMKEIDDYALDLVRAEVNQEQFSLPIIAYYGTNRAIRDEVQRRRGSRKKNSQFDALIGALDSTSKFRSAFEWFSAMEDDERRKKDELRDFNYKHPELEAVRRAIVSMLLRGFENPRTKIRPLRFVIDRSTEGGEKQTLRINQLSDGYRMVLGLVMDFARRMAQGNGAIAGNIDSMNVLAYPAIVLIDEVDLHLHPSWQQHILKDLMQTFPGTQFIVTTHSPQVLSMVQSENIIVLGKGERGEIVANTPIATTYGESSGDVMHGVMNVDPQPPIAERGDLQRLVEMVDQGLYDAQEASDLKCKLVNILGESHPQLQKLQRTIRLRNRMRNEGN